MYNDGNNNINITYDNDTNNNNNDNVTLMIMIIITFIKHIMINPYSFRLFLVENSRLLKSTIDKAIDVNWLINSTQKQDFDAKILYRG